MSSSATTHSRHDDLASTFARRRLPIGVEVIDSGRIHSRLWAPAARRVELVIAGHSTVTLEAEPDGYFSGFADAPAGARYQFRLDTSDQLYPDPASRYQPEGPHNASQIVDPATFVWTDHAWPGASLEGQVIYEMHVGTFTREGTWDAASRQLVELADTGITVIEVMPIAEFDGRFGWGYDGVDMYAPSHLYGTPDDLRRFVDRAHAAGIGVILDVVYNHLGPVGNYLRAFSPAYFTDRYDNEWGDAINFDGEDSRHVRRFFIENAGYWIDEFHLDGLRLDATQQIFDRSQPNLLTEIGLKVRERARGRPTIIVAENEPQDTGLLQDAAEGGCGVDALWNDDFHHSAMVALTGRAEAYYSDTRGEPQEFVSAAKYGYLFQGQYYSWQRQPRGTPGLQFSPARFVAYLENHDQLANSSRGLRGHQLASPARWRAMTALFLLIPATPMLFQGQEFSASAPFLYFADFDEELSAAVKKGRAEFLKQFPSLVQYETVAELDSPANPMTFERCKLDFGERATNRASYDLHRDLLALRRSVPAFASQRKVDGAVLSAHAFMLRFFGDNAGDDRLLLVNLDVDLERKSFAEPLMAPPAGCEWTIEWSSDGPRYGGPGIARLWRRGKWVIPGESTTVLTAVPTEGKTSKSIRT